MSWLVSAAAFAGCGGSSGSDDDEKASRGGSSAGQGDGPGEGGSDTGGGTGGGFPALDGGVGECLTCVTTMCPDAQACLEDPACVQGAICAVQTCVSDQDAGAGLDCWLGCFEGNPTAALTAFSAFSCVATSCGMGCMGALGP
ncbi:MAG TPA: hypothetical protein VM686_36620 [Polyangiaceae bacterium]|nr:hypothetical protein [Polyangiaceae bacterium]